MWSIRRSLGPFPIVYTWGHHCLDVLRVFVSWLSRDKVGRARVWTRIWVQACFCHKVQMKGNLSLGIVMTWIIIWMCFYEQVWDLALLAHKLVLGDIVRDPGAGLTNVFPWDYAFLLPARSKSGKSTITTTFWADLTKCLDPNELPLTEAWKLELGNGFQHPLAAWHAAESHAASSELHFSREASVGCESPSSNLRAVQAEVSLEGLPHRRELVVGMLLRETLAEKPTGPAGHALELAGRAPSMSRSVSRCPIRTWAGGEELTKGVTPMGQEAPRLSAYTGVYKRKA